MWANPPLVGTTFAVLDGPGRGQSRMVVGVGSANGTITLDRPLDGWVATAAAKRPSTVAVISSFGSKVFAGNSFLWTEVVQWYGNTLRGVMADNSFTNCNVKPGGNDDGGAMGGVGECYHGSDPMWYTEYRGNEMQASDGVGIRDAYNTAEYQCAAYGGPWVAWAVIRANTFGGISLAAKNVSGMAGGGQKPRCADVHIHGAGSNATGTTSDVVGEQNAFGCPAEGNASTAGYAFRECSHCVQRL